MLLHGAVRALCEDTGRPCPAQGGREEERGREGAGREEGGREEEGREEGRKERKEERWKETVLGMDQEHQGHLPRASLIPFSSF